jgi:WD40 repeat protein
VAGAVMADVFISYSRKDGAFVQTLFDFLKSAGRDVWVDWEDIPPASEWEEDIHDNIDAAESFVAIVSANSLASEYCARELARAQEGGKRIVPVACEPAPDPESAPTALRQLNWIWFRASDDRNAAYARLTAALDTDLAWAKAHTRLLVRAIEWETSNRDHSVLLRGRDLVKAEQELATNAAKEPRPTQLQQRYVHASRRAASRRQQLLLGSVSLALAVSVALGVIALLQRDTANERARVARSEAFAAQAMQELSTAPVTALADSVKAVETSPTAQAELALRRAILSNPIDYVISSTKKAANAAWAGEARRNFGPPDEALAFNGDGEVLLGLAPDGTLHVWRSANGRRVATIARANRASFGPGGSLLSTDGSAVRFTRAAGSRFARDAGSQSETRHLLPRERALAIAFSGDVPLALIARRGQAGVLNVLTGTVVALQATHIAAADGLFSGDGNRVLTQNAQFSKIRVWDTRTGRLLATLPGCGFPGCEVVSADGRLVATIHAFGGHSFGSELWSVNGRRLLAKLDAVQVVFSPDGRLVVGVGANGQATVVRSNSGQLVAELPGSGDYFTNTVGSYVTSPFDPGAAFTSDDHLVAIADSDGIVRIWELASSEQVAAVAAGFVNKLVFAPHGDLLAAMAWNGAVVVASVPPSVALRTGEGPPGDCAPTFPPLLSPGGGQVMAPADGDGSVGVWSVSGRLERILPPAARHSSTRTVADEAFSSNGMVAAAEDSGSWCRFTAEERFGTVVAKIRGNGPPRRLWTTGSPLLPDPHGSFVVIGQNVWRTATGTRIAALDGLLALSPDGRLGLVTRDRTYSIVRIWNRSEVAELGGVGPLAEWATNANNPTFDTASSGVVARFSPDDQRMLTQSSLDDLRLWDVSSGAQIARLSRPGESVESFSFTAGGQRALVVFGDRVATFRASDGVLVSSIKGGDDAISSDGMFAASADRDGTVKITDIKTGLSVSVQTDTTLRLENVSFGVSDRLLVAQDQNGDVHVVRCAICEPDNVLLQRARSMLTMLSAAPPSFPPLGSD